MMSHSYQEGPEDVSRGTLQWPTRWHSPTSSRDISDNWCTSESGGRQENCQVAPLTQSYLFVPIDV